MPAETDQRERRLARLRELIQGSSAKTQAELVRGLEAQGFAVTQASVSRDLRELGVSKDGGIYRLPDVAGDETTPRLQEVLAANVRRSREAGPHLLVLQTEVGAAPRVALALDEASWSEVVGTIAGDDTVFVATAGAGEQRRLLARLAGLRES